MSATNNAQLPPVSADQHSNSPDTHTDAHTGPIKTPSQFLWVVIASFVIPVFLIIGLVIFVSQQNKTAPGSENSEIQTIERIHKLAQIEVRDGAQAARSGAEVYKAQCSACHATGAAGAPLFAAKALWSPRIATGLSKLTASALKGKGAMPPQGGGEYSDEEITAATIFIANAGGANFVAPAVKPTPANTDKPAPKK